MSATGSVIMASRSSDEGRRSARIETSQRSPGALRHSRDDTLVGELAQADPAEAELPEHGAGPPAAVAPGVVANLVLRRPGGLRDQRFLGHVLTPSPPRSRAAFLGP